MAFNDPNPGYRFDLLTGEKKAVLPRSSSPNHAVNVPLSTLGLDAIQGIPSLAKPEALSTAIEYRTNIRNMHKHVRSKLETFEKFAAPVTAGQDIGWKVGPDLCVPPTHGRKTSHETRAVEAQILGPRHP